jgi:alpha-ketoglutarate-dependent taurine dioxygenase
LIGDGGVPQAELDALPPSQHPIVRRHPGTGKTSLFVSGHIESIIGMSLDAGRKLADELLRWEQHDLVMWDNRCALHRATIIGEGPVDPPSED